MRIDPFLSPCIKFKSRTPHKMKDTETYRGESGEDPQRYGQGEKNPEQNSNGLCYKIKNRQIGPHKIAKLL